MNNFLNYFLLFFIYSVIGWLVETFYIFFKTEKIINRGFLIGPYCPIYGCGAIIMLLYLSQYQDNIVTVFLLGALICSILEYLTSYIMEKIFKARWWDYSQKRFNLNGRICLTNTILFGLLGITLIYIINPTISTLINSIPPLITLITTIIFLVIFTIDTFFSFNITKRLQKSVQLVSQKKDNTREIKELVIKFLKDNNRLFQQRILKSFPDFKLNKLEFFRNQNNKK